MTYRVIISSEALAAAETQIDYLTKEQHAPLAAERWWRRALDGIESLSTMPHRYPVADENPCTATRYGR